MGNIDPEPKISGNPEQPKENTKASRGGARKTWAIVIGIIGILLLLFVLGQWDRIELWNRHRICDNIHEEVHTLITKGEYQSAYDLIDSKEHILFYGDHWELNKEILKAEIVPLVETNNFTGIIATITTRVSGRNDRITFLTLAKELAETLQNDELTSQLDQAIEKASSKK